jgi:predicted transcriptional regulator
MRRSKLDTYVNILMVLASGKPLKLTHIMQKANLNSNKLKDTLETLIGLGMAEKRLQMEKHSLFAFYGITQKGLTSLRYFTYPKPVLPLTEEII